MSQPPHPSAAPDGPTTYRIRVRGHLVPRWGQWFDPMTITPKPNGDTILTGPLADQAALHGILKRIRDLGLPLISIERIDSNEATSQNERSTT
jgi:hypothetical protein